MEEPIPMEVLDDTDTDFLAAEATIVNAVSPHVSITDRGGTPKIQRVTINDIDGSRYFDVTDGAKGDTGDTGDAAGFGTISISMDPNNPGPGIPAVEYSTNGPDTAKNILLIFKNLKGIQGDKGDKGDTGLQGIQGPKGDRGDPGTVIFEYASVSDFPVSGITGMVYVDTSSNNMYRWTGTNYVSISNTIDYASQAEAEAGINNTRAMTPLRTRQALEAYAMTNQEVDDAVTQALFDDITGVSGV